MSKQVKFESIEMLKRTQSLTLILMLFVTVISSAQIATSKKEAQKKGTYNYTDKELSQAAPSTENAVAYLDKPVKRVSRGPAKTEEPKSKKVTILADTKIDPEFIEAPEESYYAQQVINNAMEFEGTRYRAGGTTKEGMDCSGMVYATFKIFDRTLPRSSSEMAKVGKVLDFDQIRKGDLIFFKNNHNRNSINHVGIVTEVTEEGEVKFLHSASNGVIISSMNEPYYDRTYAQANRVIED